MPTKGLGGINRSSISDCHEQNRFERNSTLNRIPGIGTRKRRANRRRIDIRRAFSQISGVDRSRESIRLSKTNRPSLGRTITLDGLRRRNAAIRIAIAIPRVDKRWAGSRTLSKLEVRNKATSDAVNPHLVKHAGKGRILRILCQDLQHRNNNGD